MMEMKSGSKSARATEEVEEDVAAAASEAVTGIVKTKAMRKMPTREIKDITIAIDTMNTKKTIMQTMRKRTTKITRNTMSTIGANIEEVGDLSDAEAEADLNIRRKPSTRRKAIESSSSPKDSRLLPRSPSRGSISTIIVKRKAIANRREKVREGFRGEGEIAEEGKAGEKMRVIEDEEDIGEIMRGIEGEGKTAEGEAEIRRLQPRIIDNEQLNCI